MHNVCIMRELDTHTLTHILCNSTITSIPGHEHGNSGF